MRPQRGKRRDAQVVRIAVLRHGLTRPNAERRYVSASDVPLLPEACTALAPVRRRLAAERPLAYTSDMRRCTATLERVCPRAAMADARLRELDFGRWEGLTYADLQTDARYRAWLDDMTGVIPPGGESWQSFAARTEAAWLDILRQAALSARGRTARRGLPAPVGVLIVTHGGVVRRLHQLAWPAASFWDTPAPAGGGFVLVAQRRGKRWRFLRTEPMHPL